MSDILEVVALTKRFGGLTVTDNVSLSIGDRELHAIIGPNGAGKSTLIKQLQGELRSDGGSVYFLGNNITGLSAAERARRGLARSFQITSIFQDLSVLQNVALAVQAHRDHSFQFWAPAAEDAELREKAEIALQWVGIGHLAHHLAGQIAYSEQRQLEFAMAIAVSPRLLLLDEPMAGMSKEESERMIQLVMKLKGTAAILLVEHDMDAVFALADRISVLVRGSVIASDRPDEIRRNEAVRHAYLGDED